MKKYNIRVPVLQTHGVQVWQVVAESPEGAIEKYHKGEGVIVNEEIEVTNLDDPDLNDVEEA